MNTPRITLFLFLVGALLLGSIQGLARPARAQTETPTATATPTPRYEYEVQLSSGSYLVVERRITFGEAAVTISIGVLLLVVVLYALMRVVRSWLR